MKIIYRFLMWLLGTIFMGIMVLAGVLLIAILTPFIMLLPFYAFIMSNEDVEYTIKNFKK